MILFCDVDEWVDPFGGEEECEGQNILDGCLDAGDFESWFDTTSEREEE